MLELQDCLNVKKLIKKGKPGIWPLPELTEANHKLVSPLNQTKSDQHQVSPDNIVHNQKKRLWELINYQQRESFDLLPNSSNLLFKDMYGDQSGEFECRCMKIMKFCTTWSSLCLILHPAVLKITCMNSVLHFYTGSFLVPLFNCSYSLIKVVISSLLLACVTGVI